MTTRITKDEITPALNNVIKSMQGKTNINMLANTAKAVIVNRTLTGESLQGGMFSAYSGGGVYYAPVAKRSPGVPAPSGGRSTRKSGRKLKTMAYDKGYGQYKSAMGFGSKPQLSVTNRMLGSMQSQALSAKKAVLFFAGALSNAKAHGLHYGKFPFFGIKASEQKNLYKVLLDQLMKIKGMRR